MLCLLWKQESEQELEKFAEAQRRNQIAPVGHIGSGYSAAERLPQELGFELWIGDAAWGLGRELLRLSLSAYLLSTYDNAFTWRGQFP